MSLTKVQDVFVEDIYKRKKPKGHFMYSIRVHWEDGAVSPIYRSYNTLLEFQERLLKSNEFRQTQGAEEILSVLLKGGKEKFWFRGSWRKAIERKTAVEEFLKDGRKWKLGVFEREKVEWFKGVVQLPPHSSESDIVISFFRPLLGDLKAFEREQEEQHYSTRRRGTRHKYIHHISEPIMVEQYVAVADYTKREKSDISLKTGHVVDVIEKCEHGWWFVDLDGVVGWAPASYLEPRDGSVDEQVLEVFEKGKEETYITIVPYEPQFEDEVKLEMGVIVEVAQKNLNGWWFVQIGKTDGWAPSRYLREAVTSQHHGREKRKDAARVLLRDYSTKITGRRKTWIPQKKKTVKRHIPVGIINYPKARSSTKSSNVEAEYLQLSKKKDAGRGRPGQEEGVSGLSAVNVGSNTSDERIINTESVLSGIGESSIKDALPVREEIQDLPTVSRETSTNGSYHLPLASTPDNGDEGEGSKSEDCAENVPMTLNRKRFLAMGSYKKEDVGEVNLHRNVEVEVLKESKQGWWLVRTDSSSVGWAPSNFLERVNSVEENPHGTNGQQLNEEIDANEVTTSQHPNSGTVFQVARGKVRERKVLSDIGEGEEINTSPEADKTKL